MSCVNKSTLVFCSELHDRGGLSCSHSAHSLCEHSCTLEVSQIIPFMTFIKRLNAKCKNRNRTAERRAQKITAFPHLCLNYTVLEGSNTGRAAIALSVFCNLLYSTQIPPYTSQIDSVLTDIIDKLIWLQVIHQQSHKVCFNQWAILINYVISTVLNVQTSQ